jgi:phosphoribosylamine---glycine ligase
MNILCISRDLAGGDLFYRLKNEGNNVKVYIEDKDQRQNLEGIVEKTDDWKKELKWVGKSGLVVFDCTGFGKIQDDLRSQGYSVVGGSYGGDKLEDDRQHGQKILSICGMTIKPSVNFSSARGAIRFIRNNRGPWVVKQNGHTHKSFNYVGQLKNGSDAVAILKNYGRKAKEDCFSIDIQKKMDGVEIGVGRYFNGSNWVGPIEINIEHKSLYNEGLGPKTDEMGTVMWYDDNEDNKLFKKTLSKLKKYLQKINFRGDIDINCIVRKEKIYPLEITARFGCPSTQLQSEIHASPWSEFLKAVAQGKAYDLKYNKGFGVIVLLATPPFPYKVRTRKYNCEGVDLFFKKRLSPQELNHLHSEEISLRKRKRKKQYYISSKTGYVLHITGMGETVEEARQKVYGLIDKIVIPKMFYRTDIGDKFIREDQKKLKEWGWI